MYRPTSYKIKWRLLNALIKFLLIAEKDVTADFGDAADRIKATREGLIAVANRWAPKNIKLEAEWQSGHEALSEALDKAIEAALDCSTIVTMCCTKEVRLAYDALHNKYNTCEGVCIKLWPQEMGAPPEFTDKQIIKALNCLRAKKDLILL